MIVRCDKNFNVAICSDTVNVLINVKLSMMVLLFELYPFIPIDFSDLDHISRSVKQV